MIPAFAALVGYAGRPRVTGPPRDAAELRPDPRLTALSRAFARWDDAHRTLLEGLGRGVWSAHDGPGRAIRPSRPRLTGT